jgi:predicted nucleic acid-binding protein
MRLYLDTSPVIYTVEQAPGYAATVDNTLSAPGVVLVASDLTRMECRVKPLRDGNAGLLNDYDEFFQNAVAEIIPLTREVMNRATEIRAQYGFKTPDAIHLAAAVVSGCDAFFTNDHRLDRFSDIAIEVVQP